MRRPVFDRGLVNLRNFHRLKIFGTRLMIACLILAGLINYVDYLTGYEHSMLPFYFLPIALAAWSANFAFGIAIVVVCVMTWGLADLASGIPALGFWNIGMAFASYVLFADVVAKSGTLGDDSTKRSRKWRIVNDAGWATICTTSWGNTSLARLSPLKA